MRMDLIQPFIGSLDAVLAEMMKTAPRIVDLTMEEEGYPQRPRRFRQLQGRNSGPRDSRHGSASRRAGCELPGRG